MVDQIHIRSRLKNVLSDSRQSGRYPPVFRELRQGHTVGFMLVSFDFQEDAGSVKEAPLRG